MSRARRGVRNAVGCALVGAMMSLASTSVAATPLETAKELTAHASVEYKVGHFEQALDLYGKAYEAYPTPALLFDIGQCHKMLKNYERAVYFFHGYLRDAPDAPNRAFVERLMTEAQADLDSQRISEAIETQRRADEAARARDAAKGASPTVPAGPAEPGVDALSPRTGNPTLRIAGVAAGGGGVLLLATGVYFGVHSHALASDVSQVKTWSDQAQSQYDSGKSAATAANVFYVLGAVALATGGVLTYLGWPKAGIESRPAAAVAPTAGGATVVLVGRF